MSSPLWRKAMSYMKFWISPLDSLNKGLLDLIMFRFQKKSIRRWAMKNVIISTWRWVHIWKWSKSNSLCQIQPAYFKRGRYEKMVNHEWRRRLKSWLSSKIWFSFQQSLSIWINRLQNNRTRQKLDSGNFRSFH